MRRVDINQEEAFHSIVIMRTDNAQLANKFPHTIFTDKDDNLVYEPTQQQGFFYNMELDAFKCRWFNNKRLVLADFAPIKHVLSQTTLKKYSSFKVVDFGLLGAQDLSFYLRLNSDKFIRTIPLVVIGNTLVLVFRNEEKLAIKKQLFKRVSEMEIREIEDECFCFRSQFGLLSKNHFINNFVRGNRPYSSYSRAGQGKYFHSMKPTLFSTLNMLFPMPRPKPKL